ncbi:MAG TPA: exodeoxyribonuclease VII small subunit [Anaerolineaceae bacterium]|nr:exodeoxyribonuclease VII small subunit [Anaerolineaceae bacterium]
MDGVPPIDQMTYEQAFTELESIVAALETNQKPLEEAMALFERGQALAQHCAALLDRAELKVQLLTGGQGEPSNLFFGEEKGSADQVDLEEG